MVSPKDFFTKPQSIAQKQYEALRMFYTKNVTAKEVAAKFGYTHRGFTTICSQFRQNLKADRHKLIFFQQVQRGRKISTQVNAAKAKIISLRKKFYSVEDIKITLDGMGNEVSESTIHSILRADGFGRLPRRNNISKSNLENSDIVAPKSKALQFGEQNFKSAAAGILCLLPFIEKYGIRKAIENSDYPQTKSINRLSSILCFIALKASNVRRYSAEICGVPIGGWGCLLA